MMFRDGLYTQAIRNITSFKLLDKNKARVLLTQRSSDVMLSQTTFGDNTCREFEILKADV